MRLSSSPRRFAQTAGTGVCVCASALAAALPAPAAGDAAPLPASPPFTDADYWAFADGIMPALEPLWSRRRGAYVSSWQGASGRTNANLLILHAMAALQGHDGPTRHDDRARRLVDAMTHRPMARLAERQSTRTVCWARETDTAELDHISLDSQIAEALDYAWTARRELGLSEATADRIVRVVDRCARHSEWGFPNCLLNQINWNAQLYAHAAHLTGHHDQLRGDYRRHLARFAAGITRPGPGMVTSNLGPGYAFHYSPQRPPWVALNFDVPEYANLVASSLGHHAAARRAGMARLPAHATRLLRAWMTRLLAGSWTHAGYLNWDTGYGKGRWHSGQYWAFAQQGLLAIATTPAFWSDPRYGRWAKAIFDRGLLLYARWAREAHSARAPQLPFDVRSHHRDEDLYASRIAANAARAIHAGLGTRRAQDPPPLYAFDPDLGRLAVTTPHYSTAILPRNRGAFPYGGIDLARLYGPGQRPAGDIGGLPPAAFGAIVRDGRGHTVLASQRLDGRTARLRLTRSPRGRIRRPPRYPARPLAGPFERLEARGHLAGGGVGITTVHRFRAATIDTTWRLRCAGGCGRRTLAVQFPTWGRAAALRVVREGGATVRLDARGPMSADGVARIELGRGRRGGYVLELRSAPRRAVLATVATRRHPWNPHPGPTLAVRLPRGSRELAVRITPVGGDTGFRG
jgi:hypothetical protein